MFKNFYIDESGNTGDIASVKANSYFKEQRIFSLTAIGLPADKAELIKQIQVLKNTFHIQGMELKSSEAYSKPAFIMQLVKLIKESDFPIFSEIVDKHYFIIVNIVQWTLLPPLGEIELQHPEFYDIRNEITDYIAVHMSTKGFNIAQFYAEICRSPNQAKIIEFYKKLSQLTGLTAHSATSNSAIKSAIKELAQMQLAELAELDDSEAIKLFLPLPDISKTGKNYWMLPNASSLNSIYARINKYTHKKLSDITLFHDEQIQFEYTLMDNKQRVEKMNIHPKFKFTEYGLTEAATLKFVNSKTEIGIQLADIIAGFLSRYIEEKLKPFPKITPEQEAIFLMLNSSLNEAKGTGLNMLLPEAFISFLNLAPIRNY